MTKQSYLSVDTGSRPAAVELFRTESVDVAIERITRMFGPHQITPAGGARSLRFEHQHAWLDNVCFNDLAYGRDLRNVISELADGSYCVMVPYSGRYAITVDGRHGAGDTETVAVLNPHDRTTLDAAADYRNVSLRLERRAIEDAIARRLGERPNAVVRFDPMPQGRAAGVVPLRDFVLQLWRERHCESDVPSLFAVGREIEDLLASMLITSVPHNYSARIVRARSAPAACRTVAEYLRRHVRDPIDLDAVMAVAGVSRTTLYAEFRQHYGAAPIEYLRGLRLQLARAALTRVTNAEITVAHIALDCGFTHLARFSQYYREVYGELPSETLRRTRAQH